MRAVEGIGHRGPGIGSHASRSEQVPAPDGREAEVTHAARPRRIEHLARVSDHVGAEPPTVLVQRMVSTNPWHPKSIEVIPIELDAVRLLGQVLTAHID